MVSFIAFFHPKKDVQMFCPGVNTGTPSGFTALGSPQSPAGAGATGARDLCAETNAQSVAEAGGAGGVCRCMALWKCDPFRFVLS